MPGYITAAPSLWEKAVIFVKEHPYLTAGVAAVGVGCFYAYKAYCASQNRAKLAKSEAEKNTSFLKSFLNSDQLNLPLTSGDLDWLLTLLKNGANPNTKGKQGTILSLLAQMRIETDEIKEKVLTICQMLLKKDADLNLKVTFRDREYTSLEIALRLRNRHVLGFLIKHGANDVVSGYCDVSALQYLLYNSDWSLLEFLLKYGINPNSIAPSDDTPPLILAIRSKVNYLDEKHNNCDQIVQMVQLLLEHGADPNGIYGWNSPLMIVINYCNMSNNQQYKKMYTKIITLLVAHGANLDFKNHEGLTVLDIATKNRMHEIVELLKNYSAHKKFKSIENDPQSYVSLLPKELRDMASNYILSK